MLGIKQREIKRILEEQGFITPGEIHKLYRNHKFALAGIKTLELMEICRWNGEKIRWEVMQ